MRPYTALAALYQRILAPAYDYAGLAAYVRTVLDRHASGVRSILELAAGTCPLASLGAYPPAARVVYSDLSPAMLALSDAPRRLACDAGALPFKPGFDACVMLMDGINYLAEEAHVSRCLGEAMRVLRPGGIFLANLAGEAVCRDQLDGMELTGEAGGFAYAVRARYEPVTRMLRTEFLCRDGEGDAREIHLQRIHRPDDFAAAARYAGFGIIGAYSGRGFGPAEAGSGEIHFLLRSP